ncbi:MAG: hypothetical protein ACRDYW_12135 [Acidimicrobiales bacterium]
MSVLLGLAMLGGALVLFVVAVLLAMTEPLVFVAVAGVLGGAWWLSGKRWIR